MVDQKDTRNEPPKPTLSEQQRSTIESIIKSNHKYFEYLRRKYSCDDVYFWFVEYVLIAKHEPNIKIFGRFFMQKLFKTWRRSSRIRELIETSIEEPEIMELTTAERLLIEGKNLNEASSLSGVSKQEIILNIFRRL